MNSFKFNTAVLVLITSALMLAGCTDSKKDGKIRDFDHFTGKKVVVQEGTIFAETLAKDYPSYDVTTVPTFFGIYKALVSGTAEYGIDEDISASLIISGGLMIDTSFTTLPAVPMGAIFNKNNPELKQQFDEFLTSLEKSGQLAEIRNKWVTSMTPSSLTIPKVEYTTGEPLRAVIEADYPPFNLKSANDVLGLDAELLTLFANYIKRPIDLKIVPFHELIPSVAEGKADISISGISITEERANKVLFSKPYNNTHIVIISLKKE